MERRYERLCTDLPNSVPEQAGTTVSNGNTISPEYLVHSVPSKTVILTYLDPCEPCQPRRRVPA
jgi:hypothetical protein